MIDYPTDRALLEAAERHDIPVAVLLRDVVRTVEVLSLMNKGFLNERSVLAGSMALRCLNSPRFTVYDADFSTNSDQIPTPMGLQKLLSYRDAQLEITAPSPTPHDRASTAWKSEPITYTAHFTRLAVAKRDRAFKADVSLRGLVRPGLEMPFLIPYGLDLWLKGETPHIFVMDPHETVAEKILGWCAHRQLKHYADLAYISYIASAIGFDYGQLRPVLADKLSAMSALQPKHYAAFTSIEDLIIDLEQELIVAQGDWQKIMYLRAKRDQFGHDFLERQVRGCLAPALRAAGPPPQRPGIRTQP